MIQRRLEIEAQKNWDIFYKHNTTKFYKDRHYLLREFQELGSALEEGNQCTLLDLGCGVGNAFWPMVKKYPQTLKVQCCDFSKKAVGFVKANELFNGAQHEADVCDLVSQPIPFPP